MIYLELFEATTDLPVRYDGPFAVRTPEHIERYEELLDALKAAKELALQLKLKITICPGERQLHRLMTPDNKERVISSWQIDTSKDQPYVNFMEDS